MNRNRNSIQDYEDIFHLPHHVSDTRPHMPVGDRAAQFSPFAALTGYDAAVLETARLTEERAELDESQKAVLNGKLLFIRDRLKEKPVVESTYFKEDEWKEGGCYLTVVGIVKKIDLYGSFLMLEDGTGIPIDEIFEIKGEQFE